MTVGFRSLNVADIMWFISPFLHSHLPCMLLRVKFSGGDATFCKSKKKKHQSDTEATRHTTSFLSWWWHLAINYQRTPVAAGNQIQGWHEQKRVTVSREVQNHTREGLWHSTNWENGLNCRHQGGSRCHPVEARGPPDSPAITLRHTASAESDTSFPPQPIITN